MDVPRPWEIIAITFTNKAAGELKERLEAACGPVAEGIWAQTFHSACIRILRRYGDRVGYGQSFTIYDEDDKKKMMGEVLKDLNYDAKKFDLRSIAGEISRARDRVGGPGPLFGVGRYRLLQKEHREDLRGLPKPDAGGQRPGF